MLVDATKHFGPALWQGLMLCAIPLWLWIATRDDCKDFALATAAYIALGVTLIIAINSETFSGFASGMIFMFGVAAVVMVGVMLFRADEGGATMGKEKSK